MSELHYLSGKPPERAPDAENIEPYLSRTAPYWIAAFILLLVIIAGSVATKAISQAAHDAVWSTE